MWSVWGQRYSSSDLTNATISQKIILNKKSIVRYARTWIEYYNSPVFTNLVMRIYAINESGNRGALLHTSTTQWQPSQISTLAYARKEIYFEFPDIIMSDVQPYYFALASSTATLSTSSFIAWIKAYPDPVYTTNVTTTFVSQEKNPYSIVLIGSEL